MTYGEAEERGARCSHCGKPFVLPITRSGRKSEQRHCSAKCRYASRERDTAKYRGSGANGVRREHDRIAEAALGRPLQEAEVVHHINEVRLDNRPQNLVVCTTIRAHSLLHTIPKLISHARWLGAVGVSVRLFDAAMVEPAGHRLCVRCEQTKPVGAFYVFRNRNGVPRGHCKDCHKRHAA